MTSAAAIPSVTLNDETTMPVIGLGVGELSDSETEQAVSTALEAGYRLIDTAAAYGNEAAVGRAIAASGVPREELFVTTKLATPTRASSHHRTPARPAWSGSAWTTSTCTSSTGPPRARRLRRQLGRPDEGERRTASPGRSACPTSHEEHLSNVIDLSFFTPAINQIELHPLLNQADCARPTPSTASSPRPTARWESASCWTTRRSCRSRGARQDAGAGADPVEPPAGQRRHPAVVVAGADQGEPRRVRLRVDRRRNGRHSTGSTTAPASGRTNHRGHLHRNASKRRALSSSGRSRRLA